MNEKIEVGSAPSEGSITDEAIAQARGMIGLHLRPEGPYLQDASVDTLTTFCNGIGDVNPLYRNEEYARNSRLGTMVGHPMFPMAFGWVGRTRWGLPGVHGFYAGSDWELFRYVKPGDRISAVERVLGIEEKQSRFSGRLVLQYVEASYVNQNGDLVARAIGTCTRHERKAAREAGKYKDIRKSRYSDEELQAIEAAILREESEIRGAEVRYFEDVQEGDLLPPIVRGPLTLLDTLGFLVASGRGHTHGIVLRGAVKHPGHYFRNPEAGGGVEYTGIGHHRETAAREVGVPGTYDYGPQRSSWMCSLVTNWMGDAAIMRRIRTEMRRFNTVGDTTWCKGRISRKYIRDRHALVDIELFAENQRGEITTPGLATVILPSRNPELCVAFDGSGLDLGLPTVR